MRIVFFGSGAFGLPTLDRLAADHDVALVVSQPDRPAGRRRVLTPTPVSVWADEHGVPRFSPERPHEPEALARIDAARADAFVVIAYGHKLRPELLGDTFAINLHASLLPKYRGAAPINHAMIDGETETGVSVITLAQSMDAGAILATARTPIDPAETAGELHDRLAGFGPDAVASVLAGFAAGTLEPRPQDETQATRAPKLAKADGTTDFDRPAAAVRARIHGLTPWPGCTVDLDGTPLRILRCAVEADASHPGTPGTLSAEGVVTCRPGRLRLLEVQAPGGRAMPFGDFARGHPDAAGVVLRPVTGSSSRAG